MPLYTFKDTTTGDEFDLQLKLAEREKFLEANPELKQIITKAPMTVSGLEGQHKTDGGLNELMSRIGEANPHTPLGRSVNKHSGKDVAINNAVDRYKKRAGIETTD